MTKKILFFMLSVVSLHCYSQPKDLKYTVTCYERNYVVKNDFTVVDSFDRVTFEDLSFVDSFRVKLKEFYNIHLGVDTLKTRIGSVSLTIDSLGRISHYVISIPKKYSYLYSLEKVEILVDLVSNFRFNLPDYKKPFMRTYRGTERYKRVDKFNAFDLLYMIRDDGGIVSSMDFMYEGQLNKMLIGTWIDVRGRKFVFSKSKTKLGKIDARIPVLPADSHEDIYCEFRQGMLNVEWGDGKKYPLNYQFTGDHLLLSGDIGGKPVKWELTRQETRNENE